MTFPKESITPPRSNVEFEYGEFIGTPKGCSSERMRLRTIMGQAPSRLLAVAMALTLVSACSGGDERITELEQELAELRDELATTTLPTPTSAEPPTTSTAPTTTTSPPIELTPAQEVHCLDLVSVVAVPTATGGRTPRPETVEFFTLASQMGYLDLPYNPPSWGQGTAETPREFVSITSIFAGAMSLNVGDAMLIEWARNLQGLGVSVEDAFVEVCLQAWELR